MAASNVDKIKIDGSGNVVLQNISHSAISINVANAGELQQMFLDLQAWHMGTFSNTLNVFVLTTIQQHIETVMTDYQEFTINNNQYGQSPKDWRPFKSGQTIIELLGEFHQLSGYKLDVYFIDHWCPTDNELLAMLRDDIIPHSILIADSMALDFEPNRKFAKLFDDSSIGGYLSLNCHENSKLLRYYITQRQKQIFAHLNTCFYSRYNKEYMYIEPDVASKEEMFRRLSNIAIKHLDIRPLPKIGWHDRLLKDKNADGISTLKSSF